MLRNPINNDGSDYGRGQIVGVSQVQDLPSGRSFSLRRKVTSFACHNYLISLDRGPLRAYLRTTPEVIDDDLMLHCGALFCLGGCLTGCYLGHSCSVVIAEAVGGCLVGRCVGHKYFRVLQEEVRRIDTASGLIVTHQPVRQPQIEVDDLGALSSESPT